MKRHLEPSTSEKLAGEEGFEPSLAESESAVLPLDDSPVTDLRCHLPDATKSKSSPLPGVLNGIVPSILPQKAAKIGKLLQSPLSYH